MKLQSLLLTLLAIGEVHCYAPLALFFRDHPTNKFANSFTIEEGKQDSYSIKNDRGSSTFSYKKNDNIIKLKHEWRSTPKFVSYKEADEETGLCFYDPRFHDQDEVCYRHFEFDFDEHMKGRSIATEVIRYERTYNTLKANDLAILCFAEGIARNARNARKAKELNKTTN